MADDDWVPPLMSSGPPSAVRFAPFSHHTISPVPSPSSAQGVAKNGRRASEVSQCPTPQPRSNKGAAPAANTTNDALRGVLPNQQQQELPNAEVDRHRRKTHSLHFASQSNHRQRPDQSADDAEGSGNASLLASSSQLGVTWGSTQQLQQMRGRSESAAAAVPVFSPPPATSNFGRSKSGGGERGAEELPYGLVNHRDVLRVPSPVDVKKPREHDAAEHFTLPPRTPLNTSLIQGRVPSEFHTPLSVGGTARRRDGAQPSCWVAISGFNASQWASIKSVLEPFIGPIDSWILTNGSAHLVGFRTVAMAQKCLVSSGCLVSGLPLYASWPSPTILQSKGMYTVDSHGHLPPQDPYDSSLVFSDRNARISAVSLAFPASVDNVAAVCSHHSPLSSQSPWSFVGPPHPRSTENHIFVALLH